jgi:DNA-directed RNA polymerase subunit H
LKQKKKLDIFVYYISNMSNRILSIYNSRNTILAFMKELGYDISNYEEFSINEIDAMNKNEQLDMLLTRETDGRKVYIKYLIHVKQVRKENIDQLVEDLYDIEILLTKADTLVIITNDEPNDTIQQKIAYLYDRLQIFIVMHNIKRLQYNILEHILVPKATILAENQVDDLKTKFHLKSLAQLPEISRFDPQSLALCLRPGQVLEIQRKSDTAMTYPYYRVCC